MNHIGIDNDSDNDNDITIYETHVCFFCEDAVNVFHACNPPIASYGGLWICTEHKVWEPSNLCCKFIDKCNLLGDEPYECPVCMGVDILIELPTCKHKICLMCCKTIYFGVNKSCVRPKKWNEIADETRYISIDRMNLDCYVKFDWHERSHELEDESKSYQELVSIRDGLIPQRPAWMNQDVFIDFENKYLKYRVECVRAIETWKQYEKNKLMGCKTCPVCRANPY